MFDHRCDGRKYICESFSEFGPSDLHNGGGRMCSRAVAVSVEVAQRPNRPVAVPPSGSVSAANGGNTSGSLPSAQSILRGTVSKHTQSFVPIVYSVMFIFKQNSISSTKKPKNYF